MTPFDKGCWLRDVSDQIQQVYFDWGLASAKLPDYQLHPDYSVGPSIWTRLYGHYNESYSAFH